MFSFPGVRHDDGGVAQVIHAHDGTVRRPAASENHFARFAAY
jgi:hypothetical protein